MMRKQMLAVALCLLPAAGAPGEPASAPREPVRLRVLTYNIHHAVGVDGKLDLDRIAAVIRAAKPDIVALQEVDKVVPRSGKIDQVAGLAKRTGMRALFAKAIPLAGGAYGNALLTRLPVIGHEVLGLPGGEPRSALVATLRLDADDPAGEFRFFSTHFALQAANRVRSVQRIAAYLKTHAVGSALLAGDLNARPGSETMRAILRDWSDASAGKERPTYPVDAPKQQIDYVLFRPAARWKVISVAVLDEALASDHRPLLVIFEAVANRAE